MKNRKILSLLLAGTMTAALLAVPAQAAETPPIRVSSYKGNTLEVGERSGLFIGPSGMDYTVTSSDPDTVAVEQITGFWVAAAKGAGTAEITASNRAGASGTLTLTVGSAYAPASPDSANQPENLEIRQELIRLINQTRKANGVSELPVSEALAVLMPFKAQEIRDQGGVYYGQNVISKNLIVANRKELLNGNGFVLGVSGSGKSFTAKEEIAGVALSTEDDIIVIDPESDVRHEVA